MSFSDNDFASFYPSTIKIVPDKPFERVDDGLVDGELWISVATKQRSEVYKWLKAHGAVETSTGLGIHSYFDMPEKLYTMLVLRWS